ncbi:MAG: hypothetical protein GY846_21395 [Deltaproteobacteria bacterium]|nr:hypothetical protein [Deltaproteobacteria bacterium]
MGTSISKREIFNAPEIPHEVMEKLFRTSADVIRKQIPDLAGLFDAKGKNIPAGLGLMFTLETSRSIKESRELKDEQKKALLGSSTAAIEKMLEFIKKEGSALEERAITDKRAMSYMSDLSKVAADLHGFQSIGVSELCGGKRIPIPSKIIPNIPKNVLVLIGSYITTHGKHYWLVYDTNSQEVYQVEKKYKTQTDEDFMNKFLQSMLKERFQGNSYQDLTPKTQKLTHVTSVNWLDWCIAWLSNRWPF